MAVDDDLDSRSSIVIHDGQLSGSKREGASQRRRRLLGAASWQIAASIYGMLPEYLIPILSRMGQPTQDGAHHERIRSSFHLIHLTAAPDRLDAYHSGLCSQKKSKPASEYLRRPICAILNKKL